MARRSMSLVAATHAGCTTDLPGEIISPGWPSDDAKSFGPPQFVVIPSGDREHIVDLG